MAIIQKQIFEAEKMQEQGGHNESLLLSRAYLRARNYRNFKSIIKTLQMMLLLNPSKMYGLDEAKEIIMDDVTGNFEIEDAKIKILKREKNAEYVE